MFDCPSHPIAEQVAQALPDLRESIRLPLSIDLQVRGQKYLPIEGRPRVICRSIPQAQTPGELVGAIWDLGCSAGLTHDATDTLVAASAGIGGVPNACKPAWWMTAGRSIKELWQPADLEEIKRELHQAGQILEPRYNAYTWVNTPEGPRRERFSFVARSFELVELGGDLYRLSLDVRLA